MINKIKEKMNSDSGAVLSSEMLGLIALSMFAILALFKYIIGPIRENAKEVGGAINDMGPE